MKINELRIGNYLYLCGWNVKVVGVSEDGVYVVNDLNTSFKVDITDVRPITLTEEFFKKNGFIRQHDWEDVMYYSSEDMRIQVYENYLGWVVNIDNENFTMVFSSNLKYVHELQNAYYVSTGEEMEIKL